MREEEGSDRIYSENCARGAGAVGEGLMDTAYFLFQKLKQPEIIHIKQYTFSSRQK